MFSCFNIEYSCTITFGNQTKKYMREKSFLLSTSNNELLNCVEQWLCHIYELVCKS